jgi:galactonate dehydratase
MTGAVPWFYDVVHGPIRMVDGLWQMSTTPGLGVEIDEGVAQKHPYRQKPFITADARMPDGTFVDW